MLQLVHNQYLGVDFAKSKDWYGIPSFIASFIASFKVEAPSCSGRDDSQK
jgi:hypothetical protein